MCWADLEKLERPCLWQLCAQVCWIQLGWFCRRGTDIRTSWKAWRILSYLGKDPKTGALIFSYLPNGTVGTFLMHRANTSWELRLRWIHQIAEGLAYLHSHNIVWVDYHLNNALLTDNFDVVLSGWFAYQFSAPIYTTPGMLLPPISSRARHAVPVYDIFAFGTCLFILVELRIPHQCHPYSTDHGITFDGLSSIEKRHIVGDFDTLTSEKFLRLADVVQGCWKSRYASIEQVVEILQLCNASCLTKW